MKHHDRDNRELSLIMTAKPMTPQQHADVQKQRVEQRRRLEDWQMLKRLSESD